MARKINIPEQPGKAPASAKPPAGDDAGGAERAAVLRVTAKVAGFRRAGRVWPALPVEVDAAEFTPEQLAQLRAEPLLSVEEID